MLYQKPPFGVLPPYTGVCRTVPVQLQYVACLCAGHSDGVQVQGRPDPFGGSEKPYTVGERLRGRSGVGGAAPAMTRRCARRRAPCAPSPTRTTWTSRAAAPPTAAAPATRCSTGSQPRPRRHRRYRTGEATLQGQHPCLGSPTRMSHEAHDEST